MQSSHSMLSARPGLSVFHFQPRVRGIGNLSWRFADQRFVVCTDIGNATRRRQLSVRCGNEDELFKDADADPPPYTSYVDPNTGERFPTYGARAKIPPMQFWGEDMQRAVKSAQASRPRRSSRKESTNALPEAAQKRPPRTSRRKNAAVEARAGAQAARVAVEESRMVAVGVLVDQSALVNGRLPNAYLEDSDDDEEEPAELNVSQANEKEVVVVSDQDDGVRDSGDGTGRAAVSTSRRRSRKSDIEPEDSQPQPALQDSELPQLQPDVIESESGAESRQLVLSERDPPEIGEQMKHLVYPASQRPPLQNDELWWNWQRPPPGQEPWSAWQQRMGDSDTVMAAAMAEIGQIKLFGEHPTVAEATLARARKFVYKEKRLEDEERRKNEIGPMAYYSEWVKAWKRDTSLEAVRKHYEETGENLSTQLLDMFSCQTREEYRIMMGTDVRIRRDPLVMRMRSDQKKNVYGGDPVYPTINYEQDPNAVADYRGANFHEPTPSIVEMIRRSGRLITQEELKAMQEQEKLEEQEDGYNDDGMSGAVDIGDKEDDDDDDDDDDDEGDGAIRKRRKPAAAAKAKQRPLKNLFDGKAKSQAVVTPPVEEDYVIDVDGENDDEDDDVDGDD